MIDRSLRHRGFARRLLEVMGVPSLAAVAVAACGGNVVVDQETPGEGGTGGTGTTTWTNPTTSSTTTTTWTGTTSTWTSTTTTTSSTWTGTAGAGGQWCGPPDPLATEVCFGPQWECPPAWATADLAAALGVCDATDPNNAWDCCFVPSLTNVYCGPYPDSVGGCCYVVSIDPEYWQSCGVGRPFVVEGAARTAPVAAREGWAAGARPNTEALDPATRRALAAAWAREASFEHASVASFARLALELLAVGAPADLIRDAERAMGDEIRHAELCFALASGYAGAPVGPGPIAVDGAITRTSLAAIAAAAVREGCIGETISALAALEARDRATDPAVRAALDVIADDESRHAEMSWRLVAWAYREGGAEVRAAIAEAFAAGASVPPDGAPEGVDVAAFRAHGRPLPDDLRAVTASAMAEVIRPSAAALTALSG